MTVTMTPSVSPLKDSSSFPTSQSQSQQCAGDAAPGHGSFVTPSTSPPPPPVAASEAALEKSSQWSTLNYSSGSGRPHAASLSYADMVAASLTSQQQQQQQQQPPKTTTPPHESFAHWQSTASQGSSSSGSVAANHLNKSAMNSHLPAPLSSSTSGTGNNVAAAGAATNSTSAPTSAAANTTTTAGTTNATASHNLRGSLASSVFGAIGQHSLNAGKGNLAALAFNAPPQNPPAASATSAAAATMNANQMANNVAATSGTRRHSLPSRLMGFGGSVAFRNTATPLGDIAENFDFDSMANSTADMPTNTWSSLVESPAVTAQPAPPASMFPPPVPHPPTNSMSGGHQKMSVRPATMSSMQGTNNPAAGGAFPSQSLTCYLVQFTSGRTDTYYIPHEMGLKVNVGDYVVVEADRGEDLGRVIMDNINVPLPRRNSTSSMYNSHAGPVPDLQPTPTYELDDVAHGQGVSPGNYPKRIYRVAQPVEIDSLLGKVRDEINAIAVGQYKVQEWKLPMAIIDAEYQWDRRKLTFFFSVTLPQFFPNQPSPRIDFRTLVRDLYQIYRTRIWMYCVDKDKNRTNRVHNREKFLKQLQKDTEGFQEHLRQQQSQQLSQQTTPVTELEAESSDDLNANAIAEWSMCEVFGKTGNSGVSQKPPIMNTNKNVDDMTFGLAGVTLRNSDSRLFDMKNQQPPNPSIIGSGAYKEQKNPDSLMNIWKSNSNSGNSAGGLYSY